MSISLAQRLQNAVRSLEVVDKLMQGPATGDGSLVEVAPGVHVKTLARTLADLNVRVENTGSAAVGVYGGSNSGKLQFKGLRPSSPVRLSDGGDSIVISLDPSLVYSKEQVDDLLGALSEAVAARLSLAGGAMTGPLQLSGTPTDSAHAATKQYVDALVAGEIAALVNGAPEAINQINELAAAIGNDENFAATMANALAGKLALTGGTMLGPLILSGTPTDTAHAANKQYVDEAVAAGGTVASQATAEAGTDNSETMTALRVRQAIDAMFVGSLGFFHGTAAPAGWLKGNGALVSRTTFARLWAYAQASGNLVSEADWAAGDYASFGEGDGATTFRLPDWRGLFTRAWDDGRGLISHNIGQYQDATAIGNGRSGGTTYISNSDGVLSTYAGYFLAAGSSTTESAHRVRPRNAAALACIKY